jgi:hypothetical protein
LFPILYSLSIEDYSPLKVPSRYSAGSEGMAMSAEKACSKRISPGRLQNRLHIGGNNHQYRSEGYASLKILKLFHP